MYATRLLVFSASHKCIYFYEQNSAPFFFWLNSHSSSPHTFRITDNRLLYLFLVKPLGHVLSCPRTLGNVSLPFSISIEPTFTLLPKLYIVTGHTAYPKYSVAKPVSLTRKRQQCWVEIFDKNKIYTQKVTIRNAHFFVPKCEYKNKVGNKVPRECNNMYSYS